MAKLAELRKQAKSMGIGPSTIRLCNTADELQEVISEFQSENGGDSTPSKASKKHKVTAKAKKKATGNSKSASKKSAPAAKSGKTGKAKRPTTQTKGTDGPSGRNTLEGVDFSQQDGWNAREGSAPDRIIRALRKFKGNRSKVFDFLVDDIWDFVGKKNAKGEKRSKQDAENMLRYRISRTAFDFAVRTGQHEPSENRATYGTGGTGQGIFKRSKPASKPVSKAKGNSKSTKAKKPASTKARKAGRPKGSKNKAKAGKK